MEAFSNRLAIERTIKALSELPTRSCSQCHEKPSLSYHRYCRECRNVYMRANRCKYRDLSPRDKQLSKVRAHTNMLIERGSLVRQPCEKCGDIAEAHHPDYANPQNVVWLCRTHHRELHRRTGMSSDVINGLVTRIRFLDPRCLGSVDIGCLTSHSKCSSRPNNMLHNRESRI